MKNDDSTRTQRLFSNPPVPLAESAEKKYRRQSLHMSLNCGDEHFDPPEQVFRSSKGKKLMKISATSYSFGSTSASRLIT